MSTRKRETEPFIGGGSPSGPDGLYSFDGGGDGYGSQPETQGFDSGTGDRGSRGGEAAIRQKTWFNPVEPGSSSDDQPVFECKDGICPVPWASNDNPVFTVQDRPMIQEDVVNHPSHYTDGGIECIEAIEAQQTLEEFRGYLKGNIVKYLWRERHKGGTESLKKARWYLNRLIELDDFQNG